MKSKMNVPNTLSLIRALLVPVFVATLLFMREIPIWCCVVPTVVYILTGLTDMLDGKIARKYNLVTDFGKFIDPLADKFLVIGALLAMSLNFDGAMRAGLVISIIITVFRELAVSSVRLIAKNADGVVIAAAMPGKIKTFAQCIFVPLCLLEGYIFGNVPFIGGTLVLSWICLAVMVFFTIYSGIQYLKAYSQYIF